MENLKFGRLARVDDPKGPNLMMSNYVRHVPDPPKEVDNFQRVYDKLGINDPTVLFPMDGNDQYGDCTIAALAHYVTLANGLVGIKKIPSETDTINTYLKFTGGKDTGANELSVMKRWNKKGFFNEKIPYYIDIDPKNHKEVMQTIWLFGAIYIGFNVPEQCQEQFEQRVPWTSGPLLNEGHAVLTGVYDIKMNTKSLTWGNDQKADVSFWDACVDECWLAVPPQAQQPEFLHGFAWDDLIADAKAIKKR
jgi:hypothetical protein